jgi:hypothetical protein
MYEHVDDMRKESMQNAEKATLERLRKLNDGKIERCEHCNRPLRKNKYVEWFDRARGFYHKECLITREFNMGRLI